MVVLDNSITIITIIEFLWFTKYSDLTMFMVVNM